MQCEDFASQCTAGHEGAVGDLSCMRIFSACFGLLTTVQLPATTWSGQIWIPCWILPHFDVRSISVAKKLWKLCLYGPTNSFTVHCAPSPTIVYTYLIVIVKHLWHVAGRSVGCPRPGERSSDGDTGVETREPVLVTPSPRQHWPFLIFAATGVLRWRASAPWTEHS